MKRVLIVVDMLHDFIRPNGLLYSGPSAEAIVPFVKAKVDEFTAAGDSVIYLADNHLPEDKEFTKFPSHCIAGTPGAEVIEEVLPSAGDAVIVPKTRYSGFHGTDLEARIQGADEVHLVGVCTNICVFFTAEELCNRDIPTIVYRDGTASFDTEAHEYALAQMKNILGAEVR